MARLDASGRFVHRSPVIAPLERKQPHIDEMTRIRLKEWIMCLFRLAHVVFGVASTNQTGFEMYLRYGVRKFFCADFSDLRVKLSLQ